MKQLFPNGLSFAAKLILIFILLLCISSLMIGFSGYIIARNELSNRGKQILKNSVLQAMDFIESEHEKVALGIRTKEETQEKIKRVLSGPKDIETGTRILNHHIDLGDNGYFIIYDSSGLEVMHPTLEGQNVLNVTDLDDDRLFLVQEQIETGIKGGGFVYYSWTLPHSDKVSRKISYCQYYSPWDWIVVSTAYEFDFNRSVNSILLVIGLTMVLMIIIVSIIIIHYIRKITKPIVAVAMGMRGVTVNQLERVEKTYDKDEIAILIDGYNHMISSLQTAREDLANKEVYISYLAYHDDLTGLPNRYGIEEHVKSRIKKGCSRAYLLQIDIAGLKIINSTLGYKQGDHLLELIGSFLLKKQAPEAYFSRTSSNEFTLWLEDLNHQEVQSAVYEIRESVKEHINKNGFGQIVDLQLAMAIYPGQGSTFAELYEKTSMAMKVAKDTNTLDLQSYHEDIRKSLESELSMKRYLQKALENNEISPYYQAQIDYITGKTVGVEALARWNSTELGFVSPAIFIPAIDNQNLVMEFSNYMIKKVLKDYKKLTEKFNKDITVSINISPAYFVDNSFFQFLQSSFQHYSIPPGKLTLEITEDIFISKPDKINSIINHLHNLGIRISIDDFGTGYSSLNYLTKMKFDEMKIDKSFISKILDEPQSFQLFEVLCNIAQIYKYDIVAEGVETERQLEKIKTTSLRIIQGYLFSKPEPL